VKKIGLSENVFTLHDCPVQTQKNVDRSGQRSVYSIAKRTHSLLMKMVMVVCVAGVLNHNRMIAKPEDWVNRANRLKCRKTSFKVGSRRGCLRALATIYLTFLKKTFKRPLLSSIEFHLSSHRKYNCPSDSATNFPRSPNLIVSDS